MRYQKQRDNRYCLAIFPPVLLPYLFVTSYYEQRYQRQSTFSKRNFRSVLDNSPYFSMAFIFTCFWTQRVHCCFPSHSRSYAYARSPFGTGRGKRAWRMLPADEEYKQHRRSLRICVEVQANNGRSAAIDSIEMVWYLSCLPFHVILLDQFRLCTNWSACRLKLRPDVISSR